MSDFDISGVLRIDTTDLDTMSRRVGSTAKRVAAGLAAAFAVDKMLDWGKAGLQAAGDYEQSEIAFTSLMGSAEKAQTFMKEMRDFVVATPFEFPGLADASRKLLGYGFAAREVIPMMTDIGNVASALGVSEQGINGFVRALGQMRGKGKVSADEIRQISENIPGFNAAASIAASKGISVAETYKLMEKGAIPASEGIDAILKAMHSYPGAAGAMDRQNKTLLGSLNMLKETIRFAAVDVFEPFMPAITGALRGTASAVNKTIVPAMISGSKVFFAFANLIRRILAPAAALARGVFDGFSDVVEGRMYRASSAADSFGARLARVFLNVRANIGEFVEAAAQAWALFTAAFQTPGITEGIDVIDDRISRFGASLRLTLEEIRAYLDEWIGLFIGGWTNPGLTEGPDAIDDRVSRLGARLKGLLRDIQRQFQLFGMGIRGAVTLDDTKPMYQLGEAVTNMGKTMQDNGPIVIGFWKDDLMPVLERVGAFISDNIIPIIGGLTAAFAAMRVIAPILAIAGAIGGIITAVSGFVGIIASLGGILGLLGGPVGVAVLAIGALVAGFIYAYQNSEKFRAAVGRVMAYVREQFGNFRAFIDEIWPQVQEAFRHGFNVMSVIISGALAGITKLWSWFGDDILKVASGLWKMLSSIVEFAINTIANTIRLVLAIINGDWGKAWDASVAIVRGTWNVIFDLVGGALRVLAGIIGGAYEIVKQAVLGIVGAIVDTFKAALGIRSPSKVFIEFGLQIINGLVEGIASTAYKVVDIIKRTVTDKLPQFVKDALGIKSPSRVFMELGKQIPAGLAAGITGGAGMVTDAMHSLTDVGSVSFGTGAVAAGSGSYVGGITVGDIHIHGASDPGDPRWQTALAGALRAGVGKQ